MTKNAQPNPNVFANNPLDRAGHRRQDRDWIEAALASPESLLMAFNQRREVLAADDEIADDAPIAGGSQELSIIWMKGGARVLFGPEAPLVFLGVQNDRPYFAIKAPNSFDLDEAPLAGSFVDLRSAAMRLSPDEAAIAGLGAWVLDWHERHTFCARCGAQSAMTDAGWKRLCSSCNTEHFPRVDPVAIMLAIRGDRCLLGRQKTFPKGMYSALAGFVEPGETVEEACVRELAEESGVLARVESVKYLFAQPWPFPASLMFGLHLEADSDEIQVDEAELEHARWFTREEVRLMCHGGLPARDGMLFAPPGLAIARRLLDVWLDQ